MINYSEETTRDNVFKKIWRMARFRDKDLKGQFIDALKSNKQIELSLYHGHYYSGRDFVGVCLSLDNDCKICRYYTPFIDEIINEANEHVSGLVKLAEDKGFTVDRKNHLQENSLGSFSWEYSFQRNN